jgi:UDP-glucose 4-epimerase
MNGKGKKSCEVFNLGTGNGVTVLEAIRAFEKVSGQALNYMIGPRRPGDVIAIYANNEHAVNELEWVLSYNLEDMMDTAWRWEKKLKEDESLFQVQKANLN